MISMVKHTKTLDVFIFELFVILCFSTHFGPCSAIFDQISQNLAMNSHISQILLIVDEFMISLESFGGNWEGFGLIFLKKSPDFFDFDHKKGVIFLRP